MGLKTLNILLTIDNPKVKRILGIEVMPEGFNFYEDWLKPTAEHHFEGTITGPDGTPLQVLGVRVQINVVDRESKAKERGKDCPVGGGTRVTFVPAELSTKFIIPVNLFR